MSNITITPTMLSAATRCQMQVYWFHVERLRLPPSFAAEYGLAFEKQVLSVDQFSKLSTGTYMPIEALKEGIVSHVQSRAKDIRADDEDVELYGGLDMATGAYCDAGVIAMDRYNENRETFGGGSSPSDIQYEFNVAIADTRLVGRMDIHAGASWTKDVKTRSLVKKRARRRTQVQVDYDDQFLAYAFANAQETGNQNQTVEGVYVYRHPKDVTIEPLQTHKKEAAYDILEEKAFRLHKMLQSGSFYPVDPSGPSGWVCQEKYCGAWKAGYKRTDGFAGCPFGERAQVAIGIIPKKESELK